MVRHAAAHKHLHQKKPKQPLDFVLYFFMIATPLFELPQAYTIYSTKDAHGVSLWTWGFFFIASIAWTLYALRNRLTPLFITYLLYLVIESAIVVGIILYS